MVNLEKNKFKLVYYDKSGNALDLLILYLEFTQDLFDDDEKFGSFRIVAFGNIDRDVNEIISDNEKEPIVILSLEQEFLHDEINGKFILPLYVKSVNVFAKYDETNTIYQFFCKPFVYAMFHSKSESFSLNISPKEMGKLPNIRELLEEYIGRQPILHSGGNVLVLPASTRTFDLIRSDAKKDAQKVEVESQEGIEESLEEPLEEEVIREEEVAKEEETTEGESLLDEEESEETSEEREITGESEEEKEEKEKQKEKDSRSSEKTPKSAKFLKSANEFLDKAENIVKKFEKYGEIFNADPITLKDALAKKVVKLNKSSASKKSGENMKKSSSLERAMKYMEDKKKKINDTIKSIKEKRDSLLEKMDDSIKRFKDATKSICSADDQLTDLVRRIARLIERFLNALKDFPNQLANFINNLINRIRNAIEDFKNALLKAIRDTIRSIADRVLDLMEYIANCINDFMRSASELNEIISDLANKIRNFPNEMKNSVKEAIEKIKDSIRSLSQIKLPTLNDIIKIFEEESAYIKNRLDSILSSILGVNVFKEKSKIDILLHSQPLIDATTEISDVIPIEEVLESIADRIERETQLLQPIVIEDGSGISPEEMIEKIDDIIRPIVREELDKVATDMESDSNTLSELFSDFVLGSLPFLEEIKNSIPQNTEEPIEIALLTELESLLNTINNSSIISEATSLLTSLRENLLNVINNYPNIPELTPLLALVENILNAINNNPNIPEIISLLNSLRQNLLNIANNYPNIPEIASLLALVENILNILNSALNIPEMASSLAFSFDPNHPTWRETFQVLEDLITIYLSILLLNWQEAQALLLYSDSATSPSVIGGVIDPVRSVQIVFGIEEAEIAWFDKVTEKIANKLNDISYSIYSGNIYTALNKMIRDLCPSPVSNFLSIVYYYKDGKSHAFFRYRLYPGAFELGRSDLEICSSGCPIQLSPENMYALKKFLMRRKPEEGEVIISNNFSGFPSKSIKVTASMLGEEDLEVLIETYEEFSHAVFEGTSLLNDDKNFLVVPTPDDSSTEIPVQVEHLAYNGLMIGKFFGDLANSLVKNALLKTKFSFIGKDAYLFFLLLWTGDIVAMNVLPLVEVTELPLKSPHMFLPRFLVIKKVFYYLNLDYKDVMAQYVKPKVTYPLYIEYTVVSNDDGMKTPEDLSEQCFFDSVGIAYEKCLVLEKETEEETEEAEKVEKIEYDEEEEVGGVEKIEGEEVEEEEEEKIERIEAEESEEMEEVKKMMETEEKKEENKRSEKGKKDKGGRKGRKGGRGKRGRKRRK